MATLRRAPALRWLGTLSTRTAAYIVAGGALLGLIATVLTRNEPGFLLGLCIIAGSVIAALGIQRRALYLLIPMPALAFFVTAVLTGAVHDRSIDTSKTELGLNFLQWIADAFFGMCAATILILVIGGGRWILSRQLVAGQFGVSGGPEPRPRAGRAPRGRWLPPGPAADRGRPVPRDRDLRRPADSAPPDDWGPAGGRRPAPDRGDVRDPRRGQRPPYDRGQPGGRRETRDVRDPRDTGNQRANRDRRDPVDPWDAR